MFYNYRRIKYSKKAKKKKDKDRRKEKREQSIYYILSVLCNASFGLIILRYLTGQHVVTKNKCYRHMLDTVFGGK